MEGRRSIAAKIAVLLMAISTATVQAQLIEHFEGEVMFGPNVTSWATAETPQVFPGLAVGLSFNAHLLHYGVGSLGITIPPLLSIGSRPDADGLDLQHVHIPLGLMLTVGDAGGYSGSGLVGGSFTVGYGITLGALAKEDVDARPFLQMDISIGIFERGALKLRYRNVMGEYLYQGSPVTYHGLYLVGSSAW